MYTLENECFAQLTVQRLGAIVLRHANVPGRSCRTRASVLDIIAGLPTEIVRVIHEEALRELEGGNGRYKRKRSASGANGRIAKRNRPEPPLQVTPNTIEVPDTHDAYQAPVSEGTINDIVCGDFLAIPTKEELDGRVSRFITATGNEALKQGVCASCARIVFQKELSRRKLSDIPNPHLLSPLEPFEAHELTLGMLLHEDGLLERGTEGWFCGHCFQSVKNKVRPKFSLGNRLWVGKIPKELQGLTLPERVLISKYFCAAYIVKLFPKQKGARNWASSSALHHALRGNVSTYRLDPGQVAAMVQGNVYPPNPKILSATIGITFVGPKGVTEATMPSMFRVRRRRVRDALFWLKRYNSIYADINISIDSLNQLPEDGVPEELLRTARYSEDIDEVEREHAGYVPEDGADEHDAEQQALHEAGLVVVDEEDNDHDSEHVEPAVIPLQTHGVIDIDGVEVTNVDLMAHAFSNALEEETTRTGDTYTIRRGSAFVNEYARKDPLTGQRTDGGPSNPNHLLGCFPTLFPYGKGGIETHQDGLPYESHIRWAMQYADKRFRKDYQFPFQVFGVIQKREVCRSARIQMRKGTFNRNMDLIHTLGTRDLELASQEETRRVPHSNPAMRALRQQMRAVRTNVTGTDESRHIVRSKIWGTNLLHNPPSIWLTLNPADTQDPIAQVLTGADIDLDNFCHTMGPDHQQRASNVCSNPFAAAQFFHLIITAVFEELFGIKKGAHGKVEREAGLLGKVQSYIGTVEAQGRGTLHLHALIWLTGAPRADEIKAALRTEGFRAKMKLFIESTIRADLDGRNREEVNSLPKEKGVSYSRPLDLATTTERVAADQERRLARALQFHKCTLAACLKTVSGRLVCKRRAPFAIAAEAWVDEVGNWGPKRLCDMLNAWNPRVMHSIRANHDLKLVASGKDTATITYYVTNYATKKQEKSSNVSALLAKALAFSKTADQKEKDLKTINRKLLTRCVNSLNRYREFSGPEVMTYIMGWGDVYESHHYATIYWDPAVRALQRVFPHLDTSRSRYYTRSTETQDVEGSDSGPTAQATDETAAEPTAIQPDESDKHSPSATIEIVGGKFEIKDQLKDYQYRGEALQQMSLLEFTLETYEGKPTTNENESVGRPPNDRVPYAAGLKPTRPRIIRTCGHETLPRFVGQWFPRNDGETEQEKEYYSACMLMLLEPWTNLQDLRGEMATFQEAFTRMVARGKKQVHTVLQNIQYYYECQDGAKARLAEEKRSGTLQPTATQINIEDSHLRLHGEEGMDEEILAQIEEEITEIDIDTARRAKIGGREIVFGANAIMQAYEHDIFIPPECDTEWNKRASTSSPDDMLKYQTWEKQLKEITRKQANSIFEVPQESAPAVVQGPPPQVRQETGPTVTPITAESPQLVWASLTRLNEEQKRAHDIIEERLEQHVSNGPRRQLRMLILGEGGTGKSTLIGAVTDTFAHYGQSDILAKCATTGIAATGIEGQTLHSWAGLPRALANPKEDWIEKAAPSTTQKRKNNIEGKEFLIIDEISMADKAQLCLTSEIVGATRAKEFKGTADEVFGGMHTILTGDFHQFPPVGNAPGALYVEGKEKNSKAKLGRAIFKQFDVVVILKKQIRVQDERWTEILRRMRVGQCDDDDIEEIQKLVLDHPECEKPNFQEAPWCDAVLVTTRHTVREAWNNESIARHCNRTGNARYIFPAEDVDRKTGNILSRRARLGVARSKETKRSGLLADEVQVAEGMKAMVLFNIATEADIANGTRGKIEKIFLDSRENVQGVNPDSEGVIRLQYPPAMMLFRPDKPTTITFPDIEPGLIPITPSQLSFTVTDPVTQQEFDIKRRQYALTGGYAFTDYKSQGQTMEYVIIDIMRPPSGGPLSPFGAYVALSRSRGRQNIRLLRDFDPQLFLDHPSESLELDMERLEILSNRTKTRWERSRCV